MSDAHRPDIQALNGVVQALIDNADGYRDAAARTTDEGQRALFERREADRRALAQDLSGTVSTLGGAPAEDGSILAKAKRALGDVKQAIAPDPAGLVGAVEASEDALKARFDRAIDDGGIAATTRETLRRARERALAGHDEISALRHSLEGQRDASNRLFPQ